MKKLHLIRHAKSSHDNSYLADIDRPLNQRGLQACEVMAAQIAKAGCPFDPIFCSPAVRAQSTIEQISQALPERQISWQVDNALYTFRSQDLLGWCQALEEAVNEVVIVGHNPAMTDFVNEISDRTIDNLPTCGYVQLLFENDSWQNLSADSAKLVSFLKQTSSTRPLG
ncbi:phosphoglycerate mutase family protein [Synechococcus sp. PCC 7335]|uniref:SixA phosphatase family protein n=1 Tax=Synechococcus sp. (strain ATCC 29403 / PCC 7335) TaxID=91464 RepID=UPI00017ECE7D|nr:histidine phosphatase family protein [Synechococcus sp. PCC 7335]EDX87062.1 phosphoglycerate mutase family protein [Synechococcus sp. PCC 7335]